MYHKLAKIREISKSSLMSSISQLSADSSSTLQSINGDRKLNDVETLLYFALNELSNALAAPNDIVVEKFSRTPPEVSAFYKRTYGQESCPSPARFVSDMFWDFFPWEATQDKLGEIRILDVGCGNGRYAEKLYESSRGSLSGYHGIDVSPNAAWGNVVEWSRTSGVAVKFDAMAADSDLFDPAALSEDAINFVISQSALEHIQRDLVLMRNLERWQRASSPGTMQVHLVPAPAALDLYLLHGYRQYGPHSIARVAEIYDSSEYDLKIYGLGGPSGKELHFTHITEPAYLKPGPDIRRDDLEAYRQKLIESTSRDMSLDHDTPIFLAIVIERL